MDGWLNGWIAVDGWMDGWMGGLTLNGWLDERMDAWMYRWTDGW